MEFDAQLIARAEFSGPLPHPEALRQYQEVDPGLVGRIVTMAEAEMRERHEAERRYLEAEVEQMRRDFHEARIGQLCALTIGLTAFVAGAYTAVHGAEIAGGLIGVGGVGSIIAAFIYGRPRPSKK